MKNNKGFSLVELLAVVAILGILMGMAIIAYTKYIDYSRKKAYDTLAKSAADAAEEYLMDHPNTDSINFDVLVDGEYLENAFDPADKGKNCTGTVYVTRNDEGDLLGKNEYSVSVCCANYNYTYRYPGGNKVKNKNGCAADENVVRLVEPDSTKSTNCASGVTKTITYNIYTMDYIDKTCSKDSNGIYGTCHDPNNPFTTEEYPCRRYQYHQRSCSCTYSKNTNKYCSSSVSATGDDHTMRISYLRNSDGIEACNSNESSSINSYVDHVCWYGRYSGDSTVMTFHGYQFYKGQSTGYTEFIPNGSWFHDGGYYDDRVARGADVNGKPNYEDGCKNTCIHFTEKWMGKVND